MTVRIRDRAGNVFAERKGLTWDEGILLCAEWLRMLWSPDSRATIDLVSEPITIPAWVVR